MAPALAGQDREKRLPLHRWEALRILEVGLGARLDGRDKAIMRPPVLGEHLFDRQGAGVRDDPRVRGVIVCVVGFGRRILAPVKLSVGRCLTGEVAEYGGRDIPLITRLVREKVTD